jgi:hypothetical protein
MIPLVMKMVFVHVASQMGSLIPLTEESIDEQLSCSENKQT